MSINHTDVGDLRTIVVQGRLDVEGANSVAAQLLELTQAPKKGVVVDLTRLKFLASIGIRELINAAKAVHSRGGKMALIVIADSSVAMSLEVTGVDQIIPVFGGSSEAERAVLA